MPIRKYEYDGQCEDLARHFLVERQDNERDRLELAQAIQDAVETWFASRPKQEDKS